MGEKRRFRANFQAIGKGPCNEYMMIDAPSCALISTEKNGPQAIGRSRVADGTSKIHALIDALGNPGELMLTSGQSS